VGTYDTSVLLPTIDGDHELHLITTATLNAAIKRGKVGTTTLHAYAELYNNLTKKGKRRPAFDPEIVEKVLNSGLGERLTLIELDVSDYRAAIARCRELKLTGAAIYDALHYQAALKIKAEVRYTDNLHDFNRLKLPDDPITIVGIRK
jgi:predicted nucleic acid-binding protein